MTETSNERREVAERLREQAYEGYGVNLESMLYALGLDTDDEERGDEDVFEMLADLIDPTCHVVGTITNDWPDGSSTYVHELSCGHACETMWPSAPAHCPYCGARVVER